MCGEATTGRQALDMAFELKPDAMIPDLGLPEMNGVEVTRRSRQPSRGRADRHRHDADRMAQDAIDAGASGFVLKADAARVLVDAVRAILRHGTFISERMRPAADLGSFGQKRAERVIRGPLTSREREVLQLLAEGRANKEIAAALGITTKTAETHRARIMAKLELHSMSELVRYAVRNRIIEP